MKNKFINVASLCSFRSESEGERNKITWKIGQRREKQIERGYKDIRRNGGLVNGTLEINRARPK